MWLTFLERWIRLTISAVLVVSMLQMLPIDRLVEGYSYLWMVLLVVPFVAFLMRERDAEIIWVNLASCFPVKIVKTDQNEEGGVKGHVAIEGDDIGIAHISFSPNGLLVIRSLVNCLFYRQLLLPWKKIRGVVVESEFGNENFLGADVQAQASRKINCVRARVLLDGPSWRVSDTFFSVPWNSEFEAVVAQHVKLEYEA